MNIAQAIKSELNLRDSKLNSLCFEISVLLFAVSSMYLLSQVRVHIPWTPVPITGQSFGILVIAASLGFRRGMTSVLSYIGLGAIGLPVFAGPASGMAYLTGATSGYLLGFVAAAAIIGWLVDNTQYFKKHRTSIGLFFIGHVVIFAFGSMVLSQFIGINAVWAQGVLPFLPGALLKTILASACVPAFYKFINK